MMMKIFKNLKFKIGIVAFGLSLIFMSCESELDKQPVSELTESQAFSDPAAYKEFLARVYAGLAVSGQQGPAGNADIQGIDEGFSNYVRQYWKHQELNTDEAIISWADGTIHDLHNHVWNDSNEFIRAMYDRIYFQIGIANQYLRETTDEKLDGRGVDGTLRSEIEIYKAEARFMRALSYTHAIDFFGDIPFVTEEDPVGNFFPEQVDRAAVFNWIVDELKAIEPVLVGARQNEYGRADKGTAWMLLAKLYLNAEIYTRVDGEPGTGTPMYTEAMANIEKILNAGYTLVPEYTYLFLADNDSNGAENEMIFAIRYDGLQTTNWGGTTFLTHAAVGGKMQASDFGIDSGWGGIRTTKNLVEQFDNVPAGDGRANFFTDGQKLEIEDPFSFTDGYAVEKFRNLTMNGAGGNDGANVFVDIDFPLYRLADVYLMYAEVYLRGGGGSASEAVGYVNELRERAFGNSSGNISEGDLNLDFILSERSRELYWEGHRRTDLIRFGQFSSDGIWPWKGGVMEGKVTEQWRDLYPIPSSDIIANPGLVQNKGY